MNVIILRSEFCITDNGLQNKTESSNWSSRWMHKAGHQDRHCVWDGTNFQSSDNCFDHNLTRCEHRILPFFFFNQPATVYVRCSHVCMHTQYTAITINYLIVQFRSVLRAFNGAAEWCDFNYPVPLLKLQKSLKLYTTLTLTQ